MQFRFKIKELLYETDQYKKTGEVKELQEVAKEVGISRTTISRLVNGTEAANLKYLAMFLKYFNLELCEADKLLQITTPKKKRLKNTKKKKKKASNKRLLSIFI